MSFGIFTQHIAMQILKKIETDLWNDVQDGEKKQVVKQ